MAAVWAWTLGSVIAVSLTSWIGVVAMALDERRLRGTLFVMVSLAVGAMFGDAFIHLLPQAFAASHSPTTTSLLVLAGIEVGLATTLAVLLHAGFTTQQAVWLNGRGSSSILRARIWCPSCIASAKCCGRWCSWRSSGSGSAGCLR